MGVITGKEWAEMAMYLRDEEGWTYSQIRKVLNAIQVVEIEIFGPIPSIEEEEPDDPPAVGDCPNEYAWSERPELHTIDEQKKEDGERL
jgi:hypothetical protein